MDGTNETHGTYEHARTTTSTVPIPLVPLVA